MVKNKEGSFKGIIIVLVLTMILALNWDKWAWMKNSVHAALDPSLGALLNWNMTWGMLIIVFIISVITTLVQKYGTDQKTLKEMKKEQKLLQKEMKKFKDHPEKMMALQKKQMEFLPKTMKLSMRTIVYTAVPFVIFFRWFNDYFLVIQQATGEPVKFLGFLSWFWFYMLATIIFSSILKKKWDVV